MTRFNFLCRCSDIECVIAQLSGNYSDSLMLAIVLTPAGKAKRKFFFCFIKSCEKILNIEIN